MACDGLKIPDAPRQEAARLYVIEGHPVREIARRLGVIPKTVRKWLAQEGLGCPKGRDRRTPEPVRREIAAMTRAGCTQREIGARLGVCHVTVGGHQPRLRTVGGP